MGYIANQNKGKKYTRVEISSNQKDMIEILAEILGISSMELLQRVIERFLDNNLELIKEYKSELGALKRGTKEKINMNGE